MENNNVVGSKCGSKLFCKYAKPGKSCKFKGTKKLDPNEIAAKRIKFQQNLIKKVKDWDSSKMLNSEIDEIYINETSFMNIASALNHIFTTIPYSKRYKEKITIYGFLINADATNCSSLPFYKSDSCCQILTINCQLFIKMLNHEAYQPSMSFFSNAKRHFDESKKTLELKKANNNLA